MWRSSQKFLPINNRPEQGAHTGLFIVEDQRSYYNTLNAPNYLPRQ
jgi:hypothetical protein